MKRRTGLVVLAAVSMLTACSSGSKTTPTRPPRTPSASGRIELNRIPTSTPQSGPDAFAAGAMLSVEALVSIRDVTGRQVIIAQQYTRASAIDLLRVSTDAAAPPATVSSLLAQFGWNSLLSQDAIDLVTAGYRQWRVMLLTFDSSDGAERYLAEPVLLPPAFATTRAVAAPADSAPGAKLLQAPDTIVPLTAPGETLNGTRMALLWRRGRLVIQVLEISTPQVTDIPALAQLSREVDMRLNTVPGSSEP